MGPLPEGPGPGPPRGPPPLARGPGERGGGGRSRGGGGSAAPCSPRRSCTWPRNALDVGLWRGGELRPAARGWLLADDADDALGALAKRPPPTGWGRALFRRARRAVAAKRMSPALRAAPGAGRRGAQPLPGPAPGGGAGSATAGTAGGPAEDRAAGLSPVACTAGDGARPGTRRCLPADEGLQGPGPGRARRPTPRSAPAGVGGVGHHHPPAVLIATVPRSGAPGPASSAPPQGFAPRRRSFNEARSRDGWPRPATAGDVGRLHDGHDRV